MGNPKTDTKTPSLQSKILTPLAVLCLVAALIVTGGEYIKAVKSFESRAHTNARDLTALVDELAKRTEIEHFNEQINFLKNAYPGVQGIYIIEGVPARIIASTAPSLIGKNIEDLPDEDAIYSDIKTLILSEKSKHIWTSKNKKYLHKESISASFSAPASDTFNENSADIIIYLDATQIWHDEFIKLLKGLLLTMTVALAISIMAYFLLKQYLFIPLSGLSKATEKWMAGDNTISIPIFDQDEIGKIATLLNKIFRDMNATLTSLRESEERYGTAVKAANVAIWDWDITENKIHWAGWSHSFFGTDAALKLPRDINQFYERIHPDDKRLLKKAFIDHIKNTKDFDIEFRIKIFFGGYIWTHAKAKIEFNEATKRPIRMTGSFSNITAQKKAEIKMEQARQDTEKVLGALTESEERLALALDGTSDGIWDWNIEKNEIYYSPRFRRLLGFKSDDEKSFPNTIDAFLDAIIPKDHDHVKKTIETHLADKKARPFDIECCAHINNDGERHCFRLRGGALRDETGKAFRIAGSLSDITQKKRDERKLRKAHKAAEEATQAKSEFLANMSHEIRTPMNGIIGTASMLTETKLDKKQKKYVDTISMSGDVLLNILNDILDYSKIEAGKFSLTPEPFDIKRAFDDVYELFESPADDKGLNFKINYAPAIPQYVVGDYTRIRQIVTNLTSNGIKYTEKGNVTIDVTLEDSKDGIATIKMAVTDTGMGIAPELQKTVFDKFTRVEGDVSKIAGTGLGLAICTSLIDLMGGDLGLESEVGKGSTFWFSVPLPTASAEETEATQKQDAMDVNSHFKGQILLVEDVETNQFIITDILESMGCTVDVADNGQIALNMLDEKGKDSYDLVFMDCNMPVLNGFETTKAIRKRKDVPDIPIVALTANAFKEDVEKCYACGMNGFVSKPVKKKDLVKPMAEWLERDELTNKEKDETVKTTKAEKPKEEDKSADIDNWDGFDSGFIDMMMGRAPEKAQKFIGLTLKDAKTHTAGLKKAIAAKDAPEVGEDAHALKSITAQAGAQPLSDMCKELEKMGKDGEIEGAEGKLKTLLAEYALFKTKLESYL